jgi:hypothetical protein
MSEYILICMSDPGSGIQQTGWANDVKKIERWECTFLTWVHGGTRRPGQQQNSALKSFIGYLTEVIIMWYRML